MNEHDTYCSYEVRHIIIHALFLKIQSIKYYLFQFSGHLLNCYIF